MESALYVDAGARLSRAPGTSKGRGERRVSARRHGFRPDEMPVFPGLYETEGLKVGTGLEDASWMIVEGQARVAFSCFPNR